MIDLQTILIAMESGFLFALIGYITNSVNANNPQTWKDIDIPQLIGTVIVGGAIGGISGYYGIEITSDYILIQLGYYVGVTAVVVKAIKAGISLIWNKGGY